MGILSRTGIRAISHLNHVPQILKVGRQRARTILLFKISSFGIIWRVRAVSSLSRDYFYA